MTTVRAVLIPVADEWHALPVEQVCEVVAAPRATPLPNAPAAVAGVFNLRGDIIPLFETAELLGLDGDREPSFAVVVRTPAGPAGLGTSGLPETRELGDPIQGADEDRPAWRVEDRLVGLLDPDVLLDVDRAKGDQARAVAG